MRLWFYLDFFLAFFVEFPLAFFDEFLDFFVEFPFAFFVDNAFPLFCAADGPPGLDAPPEVGLGLELLGGFGFLLGSLGSVGSLCKASI